MAITKEQVPGVAIAAMRAIEGAAAAVNLIPASASELDDAREWLDDAHCAIQAWCNLNDIDWREPA
jgi:hypothetical protein